LWRHQIMTCHDIFKAENREFRDNNNFCSTQCFSKEWQRD